MNRILNIDIKYLLAILVYFCACYFCSKLALQGLGEIVGSKNVLPLFLLLTFLCATRKTFLFIVTPLSVIVALYAPVGMEFGVPNFQGAISLYATDLEESIGFLSLISWSTYLKAVLIVILPLISYKIAVVFDIKPWRNKLFTFLVIIFLVLLIKPTEIVSHIMQANKEVKDSIEGMKAYSNKNSWEGVTTSSENTDYVLVIGESARKDYFHIYGYPVQNTPFLDQVPGIFVDGLTSGGVYTIGSLRLMLTHGLQSQWEPRYDLNFIDLAKTAGIGTTWISNQGFIGEYDTPVSSIAIRSDKTIFPNSKGYEYTKISDLSLLGFLNLELKKEKQSSHLYVLHTVGSHPNACARIEDLPNPYKVSDASLDYVACYVSTIKKTDLFLNKLYDLMNRNLKNTGRKFSIIYFSDHGQVHVRQGDRIVINNNKVSKFHYDIPLIRIDSDSKERVVLNSKKTGLMFTAGLADWMEIKTSQIPMYKLFDGKDDLEDFGLSDKIKQINIPEDPAIDISDKIIK